MIQLPPMSTRTDKRLPYTTLLRSYDCLDKHWVCTEPNEHSVCSERRLENIQEGRIELNCMPEQIFPTIKECFEYIPRLIARGNVPRGDRKRTRLNSSHYCVSRMPSSA